MTATALTVRTSQRPGGEPVLLVTGEIDMSNAETFGTAIRDALPAHGRLVVDLTAVDYLDTAGLTQLFSNADKIEIVVTSLLAPVMTISGLAAMAIVRESDQ